LVRRTQNDPGREIMTITGLPGASPGIGWRFEKGGPCRGCEAADGPAVDPGKTEGSNGGGLGCRGHQLRLKKWRFPFSIQEFFRCHRTDIVRRSAPAIRSKRRSEGVSSVWRNTGVAIFLGVQLCALPAMAMDAIKEHRNQHYGYDYDQVCKISDILFSKAIHAIREEAKQQATTGDREKIATYQSKDFIVKYINYNSKQIIVSASFSKRFARNIGYATVKDVFKRLSVVHHIVVNHALSLSCDGSELLFYFDNASVESIDLYISSSVD